MAYERDPQPAQLISPDSMTGIINQTNEHLQEIEKRLRTLMQRISPSPEKTTNDKGMTEMDGMISNAQTLRGRANRILDCVAQLDNML